MLSSRGGEDHRMSSRSNEALRDVSDGSSLVKRGEPHAMTRESDSGGPLGVRRFTRFVSSKRGPPALVPWTAADPKDGRPSDAQSRPSIPSIVRFPLSCDSWLRRHRGWHCRARLPAWRATHRAPLPCLTFVYPRPSGHRNGLRGDSFRNQPAVSVFLFFCRTFHGAVLKRAAGA